MTQFNDQITNNRLADFHIQEEERLLQTMSAQLGYEYINLRGYTLNPNALGEIPEATARKANLVVFDRSGSIVKVAVKNPNLPEAHAVLESLVMRKLSPEVYMCSTHSLEHAWVRYKDISQSKVKKKGVFDFDEEDIVRLSKNISTREDVAVVMSNIGTINNARRITETLELVFAGALSLDASDIHIEPEHGGIRLRYRLDGVLHDVVPIDNYIYARMLSRLKLLAGMTLNKKLSAQDGRFTFKLSEREIEVRVSVIPAALGESVVMRLLDPSVASFSMEKLQLNPILKRVMEVELKRRTGLIITTGPTGSGKTTALYAFLREVHHPDTKIITIENPVEYKLEGIVQTQTSEDYSFAGGLRAVLRQDPDVIMVGEIRDREVAETALQAAQTGHLVFTTLHTNSAVGGFPRLIDLGVDPRVMKTAINIILGQRLIRVLCNECKVARSATPAEVIVIKRGLHDHPTPPPPTDTFTIFEAGAGCATCGTTGYKGRLGIFEAIMMDDAVEEAVLRDPREHTILSAAKIQGIPTMVHDGLEKVLSGTTSLDELERVIELPRLATDLA